MMSKTTSSLQNMVRDSDVSKHKKETQTIDKSNVIASGNVLIILSLIYIQLYCYSIVNNIVFILLQKIFVLQPLTHTCSKSQPGTHFINKKVGQ